MKFRNVLGLSLILTGLFQAAPASFGFALLGPFAPWMQETNGVIFQDDIGGPMAIGSGYRWNVPVVTYGFDQSFLDYFGTNGVAAVESAIQILNDLPPASQIVPSNYPPVVTHANYASQTQSLYDLKSQTLSLLLEQLGLAHPIFNIYVLHDWDPDLFIVPAQNDVSILILGMPVFYESDPYGMDRAASGGSPGYVTNFVAGFNFDPQTFEPSIFINNTEYYGEILFYNTSQKYVIPYPVDPLADADTAVADSSLNPGQFYTGLTGDDVGGLRYLLSADNVNYEKLPPDVHVTGLRWRGIENGAWRPGVEKITFVRQPVDRWSRRFRSFNYHFIDAYWRNHVLIQQRAEREIRQPDFLFCAADTGENEPYTSWALRTGTTHWLNNAALNGNTNGEGPGVIQPPVKITFQKLGPIILTEDSGTSYSQLLTNNQYWGSFDGSTNLPIAYPPDTQPNNRGMTLRLRFWIPGFTNFGGRPVYNIQLTNCTWHLPVPFGGKAFLQISTNQVDWISVATAINTGSVTEWYHYGAAEPLKFFRAIPQ